MEKIERRLKLWPREGRRQGRKKPGNKREEKDPGRHEMSEIYAEKQEWKEIQEGKEGERSRKEWKERCRGR